VEKALTPRGTTIVPQGQVEINPVANYGRNSSARRRSLRCRNFPLSVSVPPQVCHSLSRNRLGSIRVSPSSAPMMEECMHLSVDRRAINGAWGDARRNAARQGIRAPIISVMMPCKEAHFALLFPSSIANVGSSLLSLDLTVSLSLVLLPWHGSTSAARAMP
jgi:hypothetical protein